MVASNSLAVFHVDQVQPSMKACTGRAGWGSMAGKAIEGIRRIDFGTEVVADAEVGNAVGVGDIAAYVEVVADNYCWELADTADFVANIAGAREHTVN